MAHPLAVALVSAALILSFILLSLACIMLCRSRKYSDDPERGVAQTAKVADCPETPTIAKGDQLRKFKWAEIVTLTGNFAPAAVIGEGGFSTVYLTSIQYSPSSSTAIPAAIKVHRHSSERIHRAFRRELDVLRSLRHPYIVRTLGFCDENDNTDDSGAIAFEYVSGGTLHGRLHGSGATTLPWADRMSVARKLAAAVEYLHEGCDPQVVHGDIKAANVLLSSGPAPKPKLCDFGSARVGFTAAVQYSAVAKEECGIMMGSPGYVDPNYVRTGMISKGSDVYSFGVLLLELITGARAYCSENQRPLTAILMPLLKAGNLEVDPGLCGDFDKEEAAVVASLAARCVGEQPSLRPSIGEVLRVLTEKVPDKELNSKLNS